MNVDARNEPMPSTEPVPARRDAQPPSVQPMHLPLRQCWRAANPLAQPPALDGLSCTRRFIVLAQPEGGEIRAACERSLAQGRSALRQAVGPRAALAFGAVEAHSYVDAVSGRRMVPWMFVHVDAPAAQWQQLAQDLRARGARLHEVEMHADRVVLRAEAALQRLIGYCGIARSVAGDQARVCMWTVRYEPLRPTLECPDA